MVPVSDLINNYSGVFLILPHRRILPCLRSFPPLCYLKIVCGQYFLFLLINRTALTMPFALFVQYQLISSFNDTRSIIWADSALPRAIWPKGLV
jgi:hypothetical protein